VTRSSVLLVDDRIAVRQTVESILRGFDAEFTHADDGASALALIATRPFDVIFLDLKLPDIHGTEVLRRACELREPLGRVIILTGFLDPGAREDAARLGAFKILTKAPISLGDVRNAFTAALAELHH
jgi:CheY-like chemotaxis protein